MLCITNHAAFQRSHEESSPHCPKRCRSTHVTSMSSSILQQHYPTVHRRQNTVPDEAYRDTALLVSQNEAIKSKLSKRRSAQRRKRSGHFKPINTLRGKRFLRGTSGKSTHFPCALSLVSVNEVSVWNTCLTSANEKCAKRRDSFL